MQNIKNQILKPFLLLLIGIFIHSDIPYCQVYHSMMHDGLERSYYLSYPEGLNEHCPLIINMHGFGGSGLSQWYSSNLDEYAIPAGVAVVYPNGLLSSWNVGTFWDINPYNDINFISSLIDSVSNEYDIDLNRIYATGMSNGGYMAYELACELSHKITAFGSVTGNFMLNNNQVCDNLREVPIIHFHGTSDGVVDYYPPSFDGSLTPMESFEYWSEVNSFYDLQIDTLLGLGNQLSAHRFRYSRAGTDVQLVHYKIINGGHDWFGSPYEAPSVVNSSELLVEYFLRYKLDSLPCLEPNGDLNLDGQVNISDYILTLTYIIQDNETVLSQYCIDMDYNGSLDIADLIMVIELAM